MPHPADAAPQHAEEPVSTLPSVSSSAADGQAEALGAGTVLIIDEALSSLESGRGLASLLSVPEKMYEELPREVLDRFHRQVFQDHRWSNAMQFLNTLDGWGPELAQAVLCSGAGAYGIWHLSEASLQGLVDQLLGRAPTPSPAMAALTVMAQGHGAQTAMEDTELGKSRFAKVPQVTMGNRELEQYRSERRSLGSLTRRARSVTDRLRLQDSVFWTKVGLNALILVISNLYAMKVVLHMYPGALRVFGWPVYFARMGGMAVVCWTAVMYWTMARGFLSRMYSVGRGQRFAAPLDAHKDIHVMSGMALVVFGIGHTVSHMLGTVPGILHHTAEDVNKVLGCAHRDTTPGFMNVDFGALQWPQCPVEELPKSVEGVIFNTMPGLTGLLLLILLAVTAYTGRERIRRIHFDVFAYIHNLSIICWPCLLFIHGSNGWIGVGFPLVVFAAGLPMAFYSMDRINRLLRFYLFVGRSVRIIKSTVRCGKDEANPDKGALTYLEISKPPALWRFRPGMYAFICMPEYAPLQWHPFTICSGKDDSTVDFLIAGVGDWTRELTRRCLLATRGQGKLPKVALDGPFMAPTQSALGKKVLIAIGAGVGITPFLSLMSTIIVQLDGEGYDKLVEVHFYWMTRSAEEFLFGRKHFCKILRNANLKQKVFFHLHVTGKDPDKNPATYVFREALRRQSKIDREAFTRILNAGSSPQSLVGSLLPWCWANGATEDVLWVNQLTHSTAIPDLKSCQHWKAVRNSGTGGNSSTPHTSKSSQADDDTVESMVPIIFGRPDFATEIRSIGKAQPGRNVHVYVCGNEQVVGQLFDIVAVCNEHAASDTAANSTPKQTYTLHFERFG